MSGGLPETASRIGTVASLKPYRRIDSRECARCGAVAGRCEHLQADEGIIWISASKEKPLNLSTAWTDKERDQIKRLFEAGSNASEIAETFNTTRSAVCGVLYRMGVQRS